MKVSRVDSENQPRMEASSARFSRFGAAIFNKLKRPDKTIEEAAQAYVEFERLVKELINGPYTVESRAVLSSREQALNKQLSRLTHREREAAFERATELLNQEKLVEEE